MTKFLDYKYDSSRNTEHDRSSVSACRWCWSSHRCKWQDYATNYETSDHEREEIFELRSWRFSLGIHIHQQNQTRYWSSSNTQVQWDVLSARSNEKASRRSQRSESEERRWTVIRDLENYATRYTRRPTHKRLDCSDHHPSLQNVNVAIDFSSAGHRYWWRLNVASFKRKEIAWYTWRSSTHQQNFLKVYDKVGSRAEHEENPEQLHERQQSKRALVEYSWCRSHLRKDAAEIARNFWAESLHMRFRLIEKAENDVNPLTAWPRLKFDSYYFWNWWSKCMQRTTWQKLCCRTVMLRRKSSIGYHLKFEERRSPNTKSIGTCFIIFLESIIFPQRSRRRRLSSRSRDRSNGRQ